LENFDLGFKGFSLGDKV